MRARNERAMMEAEKSQNLPLSAGNANAAADVSRDSQIRTLPQAAEDARIHEAGEVNHAIAAPGGGGAQNEQAQAFPPVAEDVSSREMRVVYYSSSTGNTQNFVERLGAPAVKLEKNGEAPLMDKPYVMIMPTYADGEGRGALPKAAIRFLNVKQNRELMRGVVASGNRNFGIFYACAGDVIAYKCGVPCLYRYELRGMPEDVVNVRRILAGLRR